MVCVFEAEAERGGNAAEPFVLVLVGATIVGSMATVWHGVVNPPRTGRVHERLYSPPGIAPEIRLRQGDEMGRFLLGSTVVMLFPKSGLQFNPAWQAGGAVRLGEPMANLNPPGALPTSP